MHNASIAEWLLRRVTTQERAAAITGDLIEQNSQRSVPHLWLSLAGILLSLISRRLIAFVAAFFTLGWEFNAITRQVYALPFDSPHRASIAWEPALELLVSIGTLLWMIAIYTTVRYNPRDRMAQLSFASASLITLFLCFWWKTAVFAACIGVALAGIVFLLRSTERRKAALAIAITTASGLISWTLAFILGGFYQHWIHPAPMGSKEILAHPSIGRLVFSLMILAVLVTTNICSRLHTRVNRKHLTEPESTSSSPA